MINRLFGQLAARLDPPSTLQRVTQLWAAYRGFCRPTAEADRAW